MTKHESQVQSEALLCELCVVAASVLSAQSIVGTGSCDPDFWALKFRYVITSGGIGQSRIAAMAR